MALNHLSLTLLEKTSLTPNVMQFRCQAASAAAFTPGQFVTLQLEFEGKTYKRSYSIASIPGRDNTIDFAASYVPGGLASEYLFNLEPGSTLNAVGPLGRLVLREEEVTRYVLIATGTGVTPYRAMLPSLAERMRSQNLQVQIMQGVRTREDVLYLADFVEPFAHFPEQYRFGAYYSRNTLQSLEPYEHEGHVSKNLAALNLNPATDIVYLCGNPNMIDEVYEILKNLNFDNTRVRREKYFSA